MTANFPFLNIYRGLAVGCISISKMSPFSGPSVVSRVSKALHLLLLRKVRFIHHYWPSMKDGDEILVSVLQRKFFLFCLGTKLSPGIVCLLRLVWRRRRFLNTLYFINNVIEIWGEGMLSRLSRLTKKWTQRQRNRESSQNEVNCYQLNRK